MAQSQGKLPHLFPNNTMDSIAADQNGALLARSILVVDLDAFPVLFSIVRFLADNYSGLIWQAVTEDLQIFSAPHEHELVGGGGD